jgi:hypothetical protein
MPINTPNPERRGGFSDFIANINKTSYATKYKYEVQFLFPEYFRTNFLTNESFRFFKYSDFKTVDEINRFRCVEAAFPARVFSTIDYRYNGPVRKQPFNIQFDDVSFTILCSEDHRERFLFEEYFQLAYDSKYNLRYNDDIKCPAIKIFQLDHTEEYKTLEIELMDCMPVSLESMPLSYSIQNEPQTFQVRFNFRDYQTKELNY